MSPRVREDSVHPRLQSDASARPLNFCVRRQSKVSPPNHHRAACPNCGSATVTSAVLGRSLLGIGPEPQCSKCHARFTVGRNWQHAFAVVAVTTVAFSLMLSIKNRSYVPYLLLPAVAALTTAAAYRYAKLRVVEPPSRWRSGLYFVVLTAVVGLLAWFFHSFLWEGLS
jgi:fluoride ion exporter CrcB/FEX